MIVSPVTWADGTKTIDIAWRDGTQAIPGGSVAFTTAEEMIQALESVSEAHGVPVPPRIKEEKYGFFRLVDSCHGSFFSSAHHKDIDGIHVYGRGF